MVALAVFSALLVVSFAWNISHYIADVFFDKTVASANLFGFSVATPLIWLVAIGALRGTLLWLQEWLASTAANRSKAQLRGKLVAALVRLGPTWVSDRGSANLTHTATNQLDALDAYFARFLPQLAYTAIITPALATIIFFADPTSGIEVLVTLPLIPLFMIFIGWATDAVQRRQLQSMSRLSRHFVEVLRGLTTLRIFGRANHQLEAIKANSEQYRLRTMKVLRVSFLSGFALELIGSLSVALVAVSIGLRLVSGDISLRTGLFVLLLAPEAFLPLRMVGAQFHASSEGVAAAAAVLDIIDESEKASQTAPNHEGLIISGLRIEDFAPAMVTLIQGPSGAGKTTLLNNLRSSVQLTEAAWLPQRIGLMPGSVRQNIVGPTQIANDEILDRALRLAALDDLQLDQLVGDAHSTISGGQAQRVGLARLFYRVLASQCKYAFLDEPISALDTERSRIVNQSLTELSETGVTVIAVSHQPLRAANQTMVVSLD